MSKKVKAQTNFIEELCKYYMTFLQSGFKSTRFPKRYIRLTNEKNFKIGIDLSKYEKFNSHIRKIANKENNFQNPISVKKGDYSVKLNSTSQDLVKKLVKQIKDKDVEKITNLTVKTLKELSVTYRYKPDEAYDKILDIVKKDLQKIIIKPITEKMDPLIGSQSNFQLESLYTLEQGLSELILDPLVEGIPSIFNDVLADKKVKPKEQISLLFNREDIASSLLGYFKNFQVKDLYYDLQEIVNAQKNLDKKEIYLYFSEIEIEKKRFPLFYTQINIKEYASESHFEISFSNEMFVNKRAIQYAFDVLRRDENKVETFTEERKIYISEEEDFSKRLNDIIDTLISKLRLEGKIDLKNTDKQIIKSINFVISNNCSVCVFDKSDEALINDFEDILSKIQSGEESEIAEMFKNIIKDFLLKEPEVINEGLEDSWDGKEVGDRLIYKSPIPLNPEQLKILQALQSDKCKYVVVEGPPGTGKSHTISAIAFEYILNDKSILILSDTREALDVVENKINDTLNKVRGKTKLQNPILRLGKMGNTYNKILAKSSIDNIRTFHRAQKKHIDEVNKEITEISDTVDDTIKLETQHYQYIDREKFEEFDEVKNKCSKDDLFIDKKAFEKTKKDLKLESADADITLNSFIDKLYSISDNETLIESFKDNYKKDRKNLKNFNKFLKDLSYVDNVLATYKSWDLKNLFYFTKVDKNKLSYLATALNTYKEMTKGILGSLFKGDKISKLSNDIQVKLGIKKTVNLKNDFKKVKDTYDLFINMENEIKEVFKIFNFNQICQIIIQSKSLDTLKELCRDLNRYDTDTVIDILDKNPDIRKSLEINPEKIDTIFDNKIAIMKPEKKEAVKKYYEMEEFFSDSFNVKDRIDYTSFMNRLHSLHTSQMTDILDERIIKFYDSNKNTATSLSKIIRGKLKFPRSHFQKLKNAFPCIISSVRDFAEYIELDKDLFDLIIIDEASQVSIAQAFPALIRAKKLLVFGDKKQFSNLQSYQAATSVNNSFLNDLKKVFKNNISRESDQLVRLESFNVKTSILDFFINIANYDTRLKKHFRGYPEHIAYCSKTFYSGDLQAIRLNPKSASDVIKFDILDYEITDEDGNYNKKEAQLIISNLEKLKEKKIKQTVGIITPFHDQQRYLTTQITKHKDKDYFFDDLKLKIMTFDTCQGEERQIVFYSMVATKKKNKLNTIFPVDLSKKDLEEQGDKRAQRLNVGFSRVQELMHIIVSTPLDQIDGEIGNALRFINNLTSKEKLPKRKHLDPKSPMEKKVVDWFKQTNFYMENKKKLELRAQFKMGEYLQQLDPDYGHPKFVVDFLVILSTEKDPKHAIIEYDGLKDHFDNQELITDENFDDFYTTQHYEREKALETYGYKFIRLNKFNTQDNPVKFMDTKLKEVFSEKEKLNLSQYNILESVKETQAGNKKYCEKCKSLKELNEFKDANLKSGYGIVCISCKGISGAKRTRRKKRAGTDFKKSKVKFAWKVGKEYQILYENAVGTVRERKIKIKTLETKYIKAYDSLSQENRTFRKDRVKKSAEV